MHAYNIHTYCTHIKTNVHGYIQKCVLYIQTNKCAYIHTYIHAYCTYMHGIHEFMHTCIHAYVPLKPGALAAKRNPTGDCR